MKAVTQAELEDRDGSRLAELREQTRFSKADLADLMRLGRIGGAPPEPTGTKDGEPYWSREDFTRFAKSATLIRNGFRTALAEPPRRMVGANQTRTAQTGEVAPSTWNDADMSFEAVATTETRAVMIDWERNAYIDEIILADGVDFGPLVPLLNNHRRGTEDVVGSVFNPRREGDRWIVTCRLAPTELGRELGQKVKSRALHRVSIGYEAKAFTDIEPGQTKTVAGRTFTAGNLRLRIVFAASIHELSLVAIGADPQALIRSAAPPTEGTNPMSRLGAPAIHNGTVTPTLRNLTAAALVRSGIENPVRSEPSRHSPLTINERDADEGRRLAAEGPENLLRYAFGLDAIEYVGGNPSPQFYKLVKRGIAERSNVTALFTNTIGILLEAGANSVANPLEGWVHVSENLSYKNEYRHRVVGGELRPHPRGRIAEDFGVEVTSELSRVARYSAKFSVDEGDIVNSLATGELLPSVILRQMGAAAKSLEIDLVLALILSNPVMADGVELFDPLHGNDFDDSALGDGTLAAAGAVLGRQTENGVALNLRADVIFAPTSLEREAKKLAKEVELVRDIDFRQQTVRTDSRLDNGVIDPKTRGITNVLLPGSLTTWYAASAAGAAQGQGIELNFLKGAGRRPILSTLVHSEGKFGLTAVVQHSVGATVLGYRGLARFRAETDA